MKIKHVFCLLSLLLLPFSAAAETATIVKETVLRLDPSHQADPLATLSAGANVSIEARQGGWYQVVVEGQSAPGWLPLLSVRKGIGEERKEKSSGLRSLLSTYRTGSSGVTVATGVRGLDDVDLQNSKPNMDELRKIDAFVVTPAAARQFAEQQGLESRDVKWLEMTEGGS